MIKISKNVVIAAVVVALVILLIIFRDKLPGQNVYKVVFLTNGQMFFGKLSNENGPYTTINDVWYIVQTQSQDEKDKTPRSQLVKLGNEPWSPEDKIVVNKDQILFIETLKSDSQFLSSIKNYKEDSSLTQMQQQQQTNSSVQPQPQIKPSSSQSQ